MTDRRFDFSNERVRTPWHDGPETSEVVVPTEHVVSVTVLDLLDKPHGSRDRQLLFNDTVDVLEVVDGYAFLRAVASGYVGYARADHLRPAPQDPIPDHWVFTRLTHAFSAPDIKSKEVMALSMGTQLSPLETSGNLIRTEAGWVPNSHLRSCAEDDPVAIAERLIDTPYLWGGNSAVGIDCSGLVSLANAMCGMMVMPDSDLQKAHDGEAIPEATPRRGDLWFWDGHVAMVVDEGHLIHANAYHMAVVVESAETALTRMGPTIARKRLTPPHE